MAWGRSLIVRDRFTHPEVQVQFIESAALIAIIEILAVLSGFFALGNAYGSLVTKNR